MITDYHGLFADWVETDDENADFHFRRPVCKKQQKET